MDIKSPPRGREKSAEHPKLEAARGAPAKADPVETPGTTAEAPVALAPEAQPQAPAEVQRGAAHDSHGPDHHKDSQRHAFRKLYGQAGRGNGHVPSAATADGLWSEEGRSARGNGRRNVEKEIAQVEQELDSTRDDIDRAAHRLDRMWRRNGRKFREQVIAELDKHGKLPPDVRTKIADELSELRMVERMLARTQNPERRAELEARHAKLSESLAQTLSENGLELEFLKAVERAAGEAGQAGSLTNLMLQFYSLTQQLQTLQVSVLKPVEQDAREMLELRQVKEQVTKRTDRAEQVKDAQLADRLRKELALIAEQITVEPLEAAARTDV
ncbi:MAG: hypothetical protein M3Y59_22300 [Myxococcota bacterium]|nr:hypothetical protein [Myxococcota bacterium]